jgi:hypothetical protein
MSGKMATSKRAWRLNPPWNSFVLLLPDEPFWQELSRRPVLLTEGGHIHGATEASR